MWAHCTDSQLLLQQMSYFGFCCVRKFIELFTAHDYHVDSVQTNRLKQKGNLFQSVTFWASRGKNNMKPVRNSSKVDENKIERRMGNKPSCFDLCGVWIVCQSF